MHIHAGINMGKTTIKGKKTNERVVHHGCIKKRLYTPESHPTGLALSRHIHIQYFRSEIRRWIHYQTQKKKLRFVQVVVPSKLFSARWTSYPCFSSASIACVRLNPIPQSCFTGSTSSPAAGVTFSLADAGSETGERKPGGGIGGGSNLDFFLSFRPKGKRICRN